MAGSKLVHSGASVENKLPQVKHLTLLSSLGLGLLAAAVVGALVVGALVVAKVA